jgi:energy-coupling factor transporter ATP-binding protein EcfA2
VQLFEFYDALVVEECREVDGLLILRANTVDNSAPSQGIEGVLERIRDSTSRTCGCCGSPQAELYRAHLAGPTRTVCALCRIRLKNGDEYLHIADEYWCFDGSRRPVPVRRLPRTLETGTGRYSRGRVCEALPADELRALIGDIRTSMLKRIKGQDSVVSQLALLAALHAGGGLARGGRVLLVGPSGNGKSSTCEAMRAALEEAGFELPYVATDATDLTAPSYSGAPALGDLLEAQFAGEAADGNWARHCIVVVDELHHVGVIEGRDNTEYRRELLASMLPLFGHGVVHLGEGTREWSSREALVLGAGVFPRLDARRTPTVQDLIDASLPMELASRFEQVLRLQRLSGPALDQLLRTWPALTSLVSVCERLSYNVRIHDEVYSCAASAVVRGEAEGFSPRTAGGWLVSALRTALIDALANPTVHALEITPDSLEIARALPRHPPEEPPGSAGWDTTIIITPR